MIDDPPPQPHVWVLVGGGDPVVAAAEHARLVAEDRVPDTVDAAELGAHALDHALLDGVPGLRGRLLRRLPGNLGLAAEAAARVRGGDVVISWGEALAWPVALLLCAGRQRRQGRHLAILMWPLDLSTPSTVKRLLKSTMLPVLARRGIDRFCVPAPVQRHRMQAEWGVHGDDFATAQWPVDTAFWRPQDAVRERICAVGREMRDYATLVEALRGQDLPCHIAAATGWRNAAAGTLDVRAAYVGDQELPPGITSGPLSPADLRALYAGARFVVIPLMPTDSDNGVSAVLEAMAMGRAVIATDTAGRTDLLRDGVNCVLVPPEDPQALRAAITRLWADPDECARLGAAGRDEVVAHAALQQWRDAILAAAHR